MTATSISEAPGTPEANSRQSAMAAVDLEVLRTRLTAIADQAGDAVARTAVSPAVTESKDYSVTLLDAAGGLIVGSGQVLFHFGAASHAVKATIEKFGENIAPGDVFISNDPHNGGGLHPQDIMIQRPIHRDGVLIGWVGVSAHMIDMGGMVVGSFAPHATECYQEALRLPPVRLFIGGRENTDVWDVIRNNIRMSALVEMDMRGLVAGAHLANERLSDVVGEIGLDRFVESLLAIRTLTETEMRRRISAIEDGTYRATSWTEFGDEFYEVPCTLTVDGDQLVFDFTGASPQTNHYFNSKPYIIESEMCVMLAQRIARDLPFNEGVFAVVTLKCPEGTIVNSTPPAPIAAAHMHVGLNAADVAIQAFSLALGASPAAEARRYLSGAGFESALGLNLWSWAKENGDTDAYLVFDGNWVGGSASIERDGVDLGRNAVGDPIRPTMPDIEVLESWYPLLFLERRCREGTEGAGQFRAGSGNQMSFRTHGISKITGTMFGMRRWMPLQGLAGGQPGAGTSFQVHRGDGSIEDVEIATSAVSVGADDWYQLKVASGGGFGDALDRDPATVAAECRRSRITAPEAREVYGVILDSSGEPDLEQTAAERDRRRSERLSSAAAPVRSVADAEAPTSVGVPLYPGIEQRGDRAVAIGSNTVLAIAPDHWSDGCPVLEERPWGPDGPGVVYRTYLDPGSGRALHVEVAVADSPRSFHVGPNRWTNAGSGE